MGDAANNSLKAYGLTFDTLNILQEYGLIISDYNSWMDYRMSVVHDGKIMLPLNYQKALWAVVPKVAPPMRQEFKVAGIVFSRSGKELLSIVDIEPNEAYTAALTSFFHQQGMTIRNVG
jgi:hypothetical protein